MATSIYIETTIPSPYHTLREDEESQVRMRWTRQWWEQYAEASRLVTSAAVVAELDRSSSEKRQERIDLLNPAELLPITEDVRELLGPISTNS